MWARFWTDFSKAMLMTDPLAYGLYVAWCLEDSGQEEPAVTRPVMQTREPFGSTLTLTQTPAPAAGR